MFICNVARIFNLATQGLGKYTAAGSGFFMTMVVGGGIIPIIQAAVVDSTVVTLVVIG
jgi:FHS family L-fucose permease-like MFS transporter